MHIISKLYFGQCITGITSFMQNAIHSKYSCFKGSEHASVCIIPMPTIFKKFNGKTSKNLNPLKIDPFILIQISTVIRRSLKPNNEAIYCGAFDHRPNKPTFRTSIH